MARATKRDMLEREEAIRDALGSGEKLKDMKARLATQFGCSKSAIDRQYRQIMDDIKMRKEEEREDLQIKLQKELEEIKREARGAGNLKTAIDTINLQAKIAGIYNPPKEKEEKVEEKAPVFVFEEKDLSRSLNVVKKDDDDKAANG